MQRMRRFFWVAMIAALLVGCGSEDPVANDDKNGNDDDAQPQLVIDDSLSLQAEVGHSDEAVLLVGNQGEATLEVELSFEDASWLEFDPMNLDVAAGQQADLTVSATCEEDGEFGAEVSVNTNDPEAEELTLQVSLTCYELDPELAMLTVQIDGLPADLDADVVVDGPEEFEEAITQTQSFVDLEPGTYTVTASPVGETTPYIPVDASVEVELAAGDAEELTVVYEAEEIVVGSLVLDADNVPEGADFTATVESTESSYEETFTGGQTIELSPGDYRVTFHDIDVGDDVYQAVEPIFDVEVIAEDSTEVTALYELVVLTGILEVEVDFPSTVSFELEVDDGDTVVRSENVTGGETLSFDDLAVGDYVLSWESPIVDQWDNEYLVEDLEGFGEQITVTEDDVAEATVTGLEPAVVLREDDAGPYSLREVVGRVKEGTQVTFDADVEFIELNSGEIAIEHSLAILAHEDLPVMIEAEVEQRLFAAAESAELTLQSLYLVYGEAFGDDDDGKGGAVFAAGDLVLEDVVFLDCHASVAGGALFVGGDLDATRVEFVSNSILTGSGGALYSEGDVSMEEAYFSDNSTGFHGGAAAFDGAGTVSITKSFFGDNSALDNGGAIHVVDADISVTNSTFYNNQSLDSRGGAIHVEGGSMDIAFSSIVQNNAPMGPGLYYNESTTIAATLIASNGGPTMVEIANVTGAVLDSGGYNFIGQASDSTFSPLGSDIVGDLDTPQDAHLDGFVDEVVTLQTSSPAFGAIPENDCVDQDGQPVTEDQRGAQRPVDGMCTIGAWEFGDVDDDDDDTDWTIETFDNATDLPGNTYTDGNFVGVDGVSWQYDDARSAQSTSSGDYSIDGEGIIFANGAGWVRADAIPGGVTEIRLDYMKAFTGGSDREFQVLVNDEVVATSPVFGGFQGADTTVFTLDVDDLDVDGEFSLEVRNVGAQFTVDNLRWR